MRVFNPKALVVIGDLDAENPNASPRRNFELFRNSVSDVIIITFDQLFGKVRETVEFMEAGMNTRQK